VRNRDGTVTDAATLALLDRALSEAATGSEAIARLVYDTPWVWSGERLGKFCGILHRTKSAVEFAEGVLAEKAKAKGEGR
jgi:hypothetical protein